MGTNWIANYHALIACFVSYEEWGTMESIQNIYLATPMQTCTHHLFGYFYQQGTYFMSGMWFDVDPRMDINLTCFQKKLDSMFKT